MFSGFTLLSGCLSIWPTLSVKGTLPVSFAQIHIQSENFATALFYLPPNSLAGDLSFSRCPGLESELSTWLSEQPLDVILIQLEVRWWYPWTLLLDGVWLPADISKKSVSTILVVSQSQPTCVLHVAEAFEESCSQSVHLLYLWGLSIPQPKPRQKECHLNPCFSCWLVCN